MFLLKFISENTQNIGLFKDEASMIDWIESLPFVKKNNAYDYEIHYEDFPLYYEHKYQNTIYPLTRLAHQQNVEIDWEQIPIIEGDGMIDGTTLIDNYHFEHHHISAFVHARDALSKEIIEYCEQHGFPYHEGGFGSEDGAYITSPGRFFIHLDPSTVEDRKNYEDFTDFIHDYE